MKPYALKLCECGRQPKMWGDCEDACYGKSHFTIECCGVEYSAIKEEDVIARWNERHIVPFKREIEMEEINK